jgi:hypothetical protein
MQIGQILVEQGWVSPAALARALADQPQLGRRICSLLILRGELDPDNAARALSQQHGVPGVLQKHLEHRDLTLPGLLPAPFARSHVALPIGRTSLDALIVCVRDPRPDVQAAIAAAVAGRVVVAVAPAYQLEHLVGETYNTDPESADELMLQLAEPSQPARFLADPTRSADDSDDVDVDLTTRRIPVIGDPLAHLGTMTLVELDDERVAKDPSQSGQHDALAPLLPRTATGIVPPRTMTGLASLSGTGPHAARTATISAPPRASSGSEPPGSPAQPPSRPSRPPPSAAARTSSRPRTSGALSLDAAVAAIETATSLDEASAAAMHYLAGRFQYAVWFTIHQGAALGATGHGDQLTPELIHALAVPLGAPSIVQVAHDTGQLAVGAPPEAGPIQDRLWRTLGAPRIPMAVPIELDAQVAAVIAVGDAIGDAATSDDDLTRLGGTLAAALRRIAR